MKAQHYWFNEHLSNLFLRNVGLIIGKCTETKKETITETETETETDTEIKSETK